MRAVNLIPRDDRDGRARASAGIGVHVLLGGLGLVLVLVVVYVMSANSVQDRRDTLAKVKADTELARAEAARLKPYGDFAALAKTRDEAVRSIAASRFDWARALRGVSVAIPRGVDLNALEGTKNTVAAGEAAVPTMKLDGCTSGQRSVAGMMAALRQVGGVKEVDLASSNAKGARAGCANAFSVSIGFMPPPPSVVAAGGSAPAPAAAATETSTSKGDKK